MMPSTLMVVGSVDSFYVRCERGNAAGPWSNEPSRRKREPWHGQSKVLASWFSAYEHPRCGQLMAYTVTLPWVFTTYPLNAKSPAALSPPPSAMMNAALGLDGASNLIASPSASALMPFGNLTGSVTFLCPLRGPGQRRTRIVASPIAAIAVRSLAIHHPLNVRGWPGCVL